MSTRLCNLKNISHKLLFISIIVLLYSCNTLKYVPSDKQLLDKNLIRIDNNVIPEKDIENIIQQRTNRRILIFFRFHLGVYNLSVPGSNGWFSRNLRKIGEEPSIFDENLAYKSVQQISLFLKNKGYFNNVVTDSFLRKKRHVKVLYKIKTGTPYLIGSLNYSINDPKIKEIIVSESINSLIKPETPFDIELLQNERARIESLLKNNGYFSFSKEFVHFDADSALNSNHLNLNLQINEAVGTSGSDTSAIINYPTYRIGEIRFQFEKLSESDSLASVSDSSTFEKLVHNSILLYYPDGIMVKPSTICNNIYLAPGQLFSQRNVDETFKALSSLKIFRYVNISFTERYVENQTGSRTIDCRIQVSLLKFQSYQTEGEVTHSSGLGVAGSIIYQHKNLFKGAEIFDFKIKGGTEAIKKTGSDTLNYTLELGGEARLQIPKFITPFNLSEFNRKFNPKTTITLSYSYMRRPEYTYTVTNMSFGYNWKGNRYNNIVLNPVEVNFFKLIQASQSFRNLLDSTWLGESYQNQLVSVTSFNFMFNGQRSKKNSRFFFFRSNAEIAGNTLYAFFKTFKLKTDTNGFYSILKNPFAQFVKTDVDLRYYMPVNQTDKIVYRVFAGAAYPYGNSQSIPILKQYFSGGANSIRAWSVRSLGPGSVALQKSDYPNQTGDIKLEANVEYRFKLFWLIEGALFFDAGNIWSIISDDPSGAKFRFNSFVNQVAIGTGFGTRFDLSFFVLRIDVGFKLRDPVQEAGKRWSFSRSVNSSFFNPVIGIGYPF